MALSLQRAKKRTGGINWTLMATAGLLCCSFSLFALFMIASAFGFKDIFNLPKKVAAPITLNSVVYTVMFLFILGVSASYAWKTEARKCPGPRVEHVPYIRTFIEEQEAPAYVMTMFQGLFTGLNPWFDGKPHHTFQQRGRKQGPFQHGERPKNLIVGKSQGRDDHLGRDFT